MSTYQLEIRGLTCGHCVASVTEEISEIAGVTTVNVELNAGKEAVSVATVEADAEVSEAAFADAVDEAGYELVSVSA
ncbi:heavy metal-associated domain protein [Gleimia coleocanis DSM 15436]|uniref:Heavy metal-associated domain protein n=1 Tax=Gleimia coleocanis DSM 15436 TaxID=525245 RepID=C0W220_9ACTO|nr:cation transporter [Gleimia coleocanis]EEH63234.1 heavy metal-associated domain protein [Gleimia coleocanis DSM 15436]